MYQLHEGYDMYFQCIAFRQTTSCKLLQTTKNCHKISQTVANYQICNQLSHVKPIETYLNTERPILMLLASMQFWNSKTVTATCVAYIE